jgi:hypothetical protein
VARAGSLGGAFAAESGEDQDGGGDEAHRRGSTAESSLHPAHYRSRRR